MDNSGMIFQLAPYLIKIQNEMQKILNRPEKLDKITFDISDTENMKEKKLQVNAVRLCQQKNGECWQVVIGFYDGFKDLGQGHPSGLDIISYTRLLIIELKNRTDTDNASSRKANLDKLAKFKKENPEYTAIYGCINDDTEEKTNDIEPIPPTNEVLKDLCRKNGLQVRGKKEDLIKRLEEKNIEIPYKKDIIMHNGVEIRYMVGRKFLEFIFGEDTDTIVDCFKSVMEKNPI